MRTRGFDVIVIGAGTAGMVAGAVLAELGARVCVMAKGIGSTHLAPGTIDVLGYAPERVPSPKEAIAALVEAQPHHPYALLGIEAVSDAIDWFRAASREGPPGYAYTGDLEHNLLLPTAIGALKPSAVVPATFAAGDALGLGRLAVVGIPQLRDFHAELCAANLRLAGVEATAISLELELDRADESTLGLARRLEDAHWRAYLSARLAPLVGFADQVALPAVLGLREPGAVHADLQERLGRAVFEIPTLPPSVPGMRLFELLDHTLRSAGGGLVVGAGVVSHRRGGDRVVSVDVASAGSNTTYTADMFLLATGGFHSGAITLDSRGEARDQVLDLPLAGIPAAEAPRFTPSYLDEQPLARAGIAVDADLRAVGADNVLVAGASLPGAVPWLEASGEGIALSSGHRAAHLLAAALGQRTAA